MRKIITIIILSCFACVAKAENDFYTEFKQQATEALKYVNKRIFTTGLLSDYGFSWVDYGEFNGHLNDSVCLNYDCWKAIYGGLYDSQINNNISMPELEAVTENLEKTGAVGIIYYEYDRFREDALEEGLITNSDGYVRLVSGKPSPFERKECFAVSFPMNQKEGQIMIMLLKKDAYYSNTGASITKMEVDFDGSGYKTVAWNTPIRWVYSSTGVKEIKFRASFSNGKCLECRNIVNVTKSKGSDPSKVEGPQLAIEKFADVEADGNHDGGSIDVAYISSIGSSTGKKFVRPLIIVGDMDLSALSEDLKMDLSILAQKSGTSLAELNRIFDIAYINYNDGLGDLTRNGEMVRQAIKKINANKSQYGCDKSYVIGLGMGGVVARIALNKMEIAGENHNVKKFIAINSPFQGINIPIGLQFSILQIDKFINRIESKVSQSINEFANIRAVADLFDKPAIKQLLIHRINPNLEYDNSFHDALLSFKGWMINPKNCESIAITAGYYHDNYIDRLFQPHSDLLIIENFKQHYKDPEHPNRGYWLGRGTVTIDINAKSLPENKIESIYSGELTYKEKVVIFHVRNSVTERASFNSTIDMFPIDGTNGCYIPIDLIVGKDELINSMLKIDKFCFLPTYSALDVSDISKYFGLSNIETPFDKYFVTEKSQSYGDFSGVVDILMREVAPVITGDTRDVLGDVVLKADNFIDLPLVKYEWKFRNGKFKVVSQSGAEAVVRPLDYSGATDYVTVTATPLLDIPELSGLKVTFPEREITSEEIEIEGLESISRDDNYYSLTYLPNDDCTVDWSCSDGLVVEKTIGEAALAHVKEFSKDSWIEATLRHGDTSYKFHKDLICARIDSIRFSVVHKKWNKASQAYKYGYMVTLYPEDIDLELVHFCWDNTVHIYNISDTSRVDEAPKWTSYGGNGIASIKTDGDVAPCMPQAEFRDSINVRTDTIVGIVKDPFLPGFGDNSGINLNSLVGPGGEPIEHDDIVMYGKNCAVVTMPSVNSEQFASGKIICDITDDFGTKYRVSHNMWSGWIQDYKCSVSPNPAGDSLNVRAETAGGEAPQEPQAVTVLLYSETGLVARQTVDDIREGGNVDVSHLPEGTYYMNIEAEGTVVDRQVIVIRR